MYPIIDCHCHIYPDKIAEKAATATCDFYGGLGSTLDGKVLYKNTNTDDLTVKVGANSRVMFEKGNISDNIAYLADLKENELFEELLNFDYYESSYDVLNEGVSEFFKSMDDDFSTPKAIAAIFSFIKKSNKDLNEGNGNRKGVVL